MVKETVFANRFSRLALFAVFVSLAFVNLSLSVSYAEDSGKSREKLQEMGLDFTTESFLKAAGRDVKAVELFLKAGFDVNAANEYGETALHVAAYNDDENIVKMLIKAGADVNAEDKNLDGETPLLRAVKNGRRGIKTTPLLIMAGADLKVRYRGDSILHEAVSHDSPEQVKLLIANGADIEAKNEKGETPLFLSASLGRKTTAVLIDSRANVNTRNVDGETPLIASAAVGEIESIRLLLKAKADVNVADKQGNTALINAAGMLRSRMKMKVVDIGEPVVTEMVEMLISAGADVRAKTNDDGTTALLAAAREGHADAAALLLKAKVDINARSKPDGYTALIEAAKAGHEEVVKVLLTNGADSKLKDRVGRTALAWATDYPGIVALLGGKAASATASKPKAASVLPEQRERARQTLENLGYREYNEEMFIMSAYKGEIEAAKAFLEYGLKVDSKDPGDHVTTPLLAAARLNDPALGIFLIKAGADGNAKDQNGSTAILLAASQCGMKELVQELIKAKVDVNARAAGGATALVMAEVMNCGETVKVLKKAGARR